MVAQLVFIVLFLAAVALFTYNVRKVARNIRLGRPWQPTTTPAQRWRTMALVALGQKKMFTRPIPALLHLFVYAGFIIINIEVAEIIADGIFGTHRILSAIIPDSLYYFIITCFEWLAVGVLLGVIVFLVRRNIIRLKRFISKDLNGWPRSDANYILIAEVLLMSAFLIFDASDFTINSKYALMGTASPSYFLLGQFITNTSHETLHTIEQACWWFHIIGIFIFLNYLPYSKHFHIILAFPNTFYSNLDPQGEMSTMGSITNEVKAMLDPSFTPPTADPNAPAMRFGAKDVTDLTWKQLMDAYSCTECGRCSSACPANQTGKMLSPRSIMMKTRDRLEEVGKNIDKHGKDYTDNKSLLHDYITAEELWACTTCNACVTECPVNINPLNIITDLRRYLVMEESAIPTELAAMSSNIENNAAPWKFSPADRFNWADGLEIPTAADYAAKGEAPEVLFWVGCAGSFDERYKSVTRAFANILKTANIPFAVLGVEESCTGDPAKRSGNEFLAQMMALNNITIMNGYGIKKIVTACPHCFNTLKNEYPDMGGHYEVMHHTQLLQQLMLDGKVRINDGAMSTTTITYHDSCYLGRANDIYEAPRAVLEGLKADLKEMKKCRTTGMCCGAGGGQMFKEEEKGAERVNHARTAQAIETGAAIIASACPFCMTMMSDGVKSHEKDSTIQVMDIAELVEKAMKP